MKWTGLVMAVLIALPLAGCLQGGSNESKDDPETPVVPSEPLSFAEARVIDPVRSGGEPVIFITPSGTILMAVHPGFTHVQPPPGPEVLQPAQGQSYLFRSTDNGTTWTHVPGILPTGLGPRNAAMGVSDPDLATNEAGDRLVFVDLQFPASISTSASTDDGATWPGAQPAATTSSDTSIDRPWLAYANGTFFLLYNGDSNGHWRLRSSPDGLAWSDHSTPGDGSFPGAMAVGPAGEIYVGNGDQVWASTDHGVTFASSELPGNPQTGIVAQRPAVDDAGTVYFPWSEGTGIYYAASHDQGKTWGPAMSITTALPGWNPDSPGTHIWPWPVAGAPGRLAIAWLGTNETNSDAAAVTDAWRVHVAVIQDADTARPTVEAMVVPSAVATVGGICLNGTICEAQGLDRRLGDFITIAADRDGLLHVAYGTTTTDHSISSPAYIRQVDGPLLR